MSEGEGFTATQQEYIDLLNKLISSLESRRAEAAAQRDHAHDCLQALLDFVHIIAPEANAEEIDEAQRVLREE